MIPRIKLIVPIAVLGLMTAGPWQQSSAQSDTVVQTFYAIGLEHAQNHPYNFTGRVFEFNDTEEEIASATLLRRHTALTAAHVVFDPTLGFSTNLSFSRGLYGNYSLSEQQVTAVNCLAGYQSTVVTYGEAAIEVDPYDLGYLVITDPPVDSDWGVYDADPTQLTNDAPRFILGYPGETFDGRTMAYCVPQAPYVEIGLTATGAFNNDLYVLEPGFSGGPVYAVVNNQQVVVAEVTTSNGDTTGEFNVETVRAVDTTAAKFLQDAEYTNGLISAVPISGPAVAKRGKTRTYTLKIEFAEPNPNGSPATTNRYPELKLNSDTPGTAAEPLTTIKKISNTQFQVVFSTALRPGTTVNLTGYYDHDMPAPNSTLAVLLK